MKDLPTDSNSITSQELDFIYSEDFISIAERIYGYGWLSPGGEHTAKELFLKLQLRPGMRVLDIGSGIGGAAIYLARQYGIYVHGVDYSSNMFNLSNKRLALQEEKVRDRVKFSFGDIMTMEFEEDSFEVIYSRDVILHILEKEVLFKKIKGWLKPTGKLLITDFCRGISDPSEAYLQFALNSKYSMPKVEEYAEFLKQSGFNLVETSDQGDEFSAICKSELKHFLAAEEAIVGDFGRKLFDHMAFRWKTKIEHTESKEHAWGIFLAEG